VLSAVRQSKIQEQLKSKSFITTRALSDSLGVDVSTIRRDLVALEKSGLLTRTHGGAVLVDGGSLADVPYKIKVSAHLAEKAAIGRAAAAFVSPGATVVVDSGSTTFHLISALRDSVSKLTVVTNDLRIAHTCADTKGWNLLVTGGHLIENVYTLAGERAVDFMDGVRADYAFLGADAVDMRAGVTNSDPQEARLKQSMIKASNKVFLLADSSKFGHRSVNYVSDLNAFSTIVTDTKVEIPARASYPDSLVLVEPDR